MGARAIHSKLSFSREEDRSTFDFMADVVEKVYQEETEGLVAIEVTVAFVEEYQPREIDEE